MNEKYGDLEVGLQSYNNNYGTEVPSPNYNNRTKVLSPSGNKYNKLPHINLIEYYQFITFRTHDSIDEFLLKIRNENISNKQKEYKIDTYLDSSNQGSYLNGKILDYLYNYFLDKDKKLFDLVAFCIMPNHIHILFKQNYDLSKTMKQIKGSTSFAINKILNKKGSFWESNYFDKAIRDEKHFFTTYEYIKNNPIKANLKDFEKRFYGIYE